MAVSSKAKEIKMPAKKPPFQRLMNGYIECPKTGCWLWGGHKYRNGYGAIKAFGKMVLTHRFSYELHCGPIPDGCEILHSCDVKNCINPDHLRAGSRAENMREAAERGLMRKGESHPMYGKKNPRPRQANKVMVLGVIYDSQKQAEKALGLGSGTVRYWIRSKPEKAVILKKGELNEHGK